MNHFKDFVVVVNEKPFLSVKSTRPRRLHLATYIQVQSRQKEGQTWRGAKKRHGLATLATDVVGKADAVCVAFEDLCLALKEEDRRFFTTKKSNSPTQGDNDQSLENPGICPGIGIASSLLWTSLCSVRVYCEQM